MTCRSGVRRLVEALEEVTNGIEGCVPAISLKKNHPGMVEKLRLARALALEEGLPEAHRALTKLIEGLSRDDNVMCKEDFLEVYRRILRDYCIR